MPTFHNDVIDAALNKIKTSCDGIQVVTAASAVLTSAQAIDTDNWTLASNSSGGGRKITFATHASTSVNSISVASAGSATKIRCIDSAVVLMTASITSAPIALAAVDTVKINSFVVAIKDPT